MNNKLKDNVVIEFFDQKSGKFLWAVDEKGVKGQPVDSLINECNQIYDIYGSDIDWELGIIATERGSAKDDLLKMIRSLSD
jgi:hypothetical protein